MILLNFNFWSNFCFLATVFCLLASFRISWVRSVLMKSLQLEETEAALCGYPSSTSLIICMYCSWTANMWYPNSLGCCKDQSSHCSKLCAKGLAGSGEHNPIVKLTWGIARGIGIAFFCISVMELPLWYRGHLSTCQPCKKEVHT